ncbi:uncharacterized protein LOC142827931 [Pelodiscus sinensis]|uniref:uncharacterized protein LOC142827931 n=1 Tax=Pelodiscus sinensis TaxID=13735 RepID=UPI003F6B0ABA
MEPELALHLLVHFLDLLLQACQQWLEAAWHHLVHVSPLPLHLAALGAVEQSRRRPGTGMPRRIWRLDNSSDWWDPIVLERWEDRQWTQNFRMRRDTFLELCEWLAPALRRRDTCMRPAIPLQKRVAIALWKLSTPDSYRSVGNQFSVGRSTVGAVLMQVRRSSATEPGGRGAARRGWAAPGTKGGREEANASRTGGVGLSRPYYMPPGGLLPGVGRGALPGHERSQPPGRPTDWRFAVSLSTGGQGHQPGAAPQGGPPRRPGRCHPGIRRPRLPQLRGGYRRDAHPHPCPGTPGVPLREPQGVLLHPPAGRV